MDPNTLTDRASAGAYLGIALIFAAVAVTLAWLRVEGVINPAASQIVSLGIAAAVVIVVLRVLELWVNNRD